MKITKSKHNRMITFKIYKLLSKEDILYYKTYTTQILQFVKLNHFVSRFPSTWETKTPSTKWNLCFRSKIHRSILGLAPNHSLTVSKAGLYLFH